MDGVEETRQIRNDTQDWELRCVDLHWNVFETVLQMNLCFFLFIQFVIFGLQQICLMADRKFEDWDAGFVIEHDIRSDRRLENCVNLDEWREW